LVPGQARAAIEACPDLQRVLKELADGRFSPGEPGRYSDLVDRIWNHDWFLVAADFADYDAAQARVDTAWRDPAGWTRMAVLNAARMGFFSSDRAIRGYMADIWSVESALAGRGKG
jgi:starch phosphorylase